VPTGLSRQPAWLSPPSDQRASASGGKRGTHRSTAACPDGSTRERRYGVDLKTNREAVGLAAEWPSQRGVVPRARMRRSRVPDELGARWVAIPTRSKNAPRPSRNRGDTRTRRHARTAPGGLSDRSRRGIQVHPPQIPAHACGTGSCPSSSCGLETTASPRIRWKPPQEVQGRRAARA